MQGLRVASAATPLPSLHLTRESAWQSACRTTLGRAWHGGQFQTPQGPWARATGTVNSCPMAGSSVPCPHPWVVHETLGK